MKREAIFFYMMFFSFTFLLANHPENYQLTGTWVATVEYNHSFDTYKIAFLENGRCNIRITNDNAYQEAIGNWSYDGSIFKLNVLFRNANISYQNNIQWASVLNFAVDGNSFNIIGKSSNNGPQIRFTFFKQDNSLDENDIPKAVDILCENIPSRSRIAIVGITTADPNEAILYLNELTLHFVNSKKYTVVDRSDIDKVLVEQKFQISGYVDDGAFVSIGKFIGATVVITGNISGTGSQKRLVLKAIDVSTSEILGMASIFL